MYVDVVASAVAATVRFSLLPLLLLLFLLRSSFALRTTRSSGKRASSSLPLIPKKLERSTSSYSNTIHTHTHKHWHKYTPASAPSHTIAYKFTYAHSAGHQVPFRMSKSSEIKKGIPRKWVRRTKRERYRGERNVGERVGIASESRREDCELNEMLAASRPGKKNSSLSATGRRLQIKVQQIKFQNIFDD